MEEGSVCLSVCLSVCRRMRAVSEYQPSHIAEHNITGSGRVNMYFWFSAEASGHQLSEDTVGVCYILLCIEHFFTNSGFGAIH